MTYNCDRANGCNRSTRLYASTTPNIWCTQACKSRLVKREQVEEMNESQINDNDVNLMMATAAATDRDINHTNHAARESQRERDEYQKKKKRTMQTGIQGTTKLSSHIITHLIHQLAEYIYIHKTQEDNPILWQWRNKPQQCKRSRE